MEVLNAGKADAYKAALAELDERTQADWQDQVASELEDANEDEDAEQSTADTDGLVKYIECSVLPDCVKELQYVENRSVIRAQIFGDALNFNRLEPLGRYEVHLDRKLERAVSMLLRLRELRR